MKPVAKKDPFPFSLLLLFVVYYMAQPFYMTYVSVYQNHIGMSNTMIGVVGAIAAAVMFFINPIMGAMTDKARDKNRMVAVLLLITAVVVLLFYFGYLFPKGSMEVFAITAMGMLLYQIFYSPATTLLEANAVERLNERRGRWNSGHIRLGGTLGFMISSLISSVIIGDDHYERMFAIMSFFCIVCAIWIWRLPPVPGKARKKEKVRYREIFKNRPFLVMLLLQFTNSLGMMFFRFYNIYLTEDVAAGGLGFDNGIIGIIAFTSAIMEIPLFWNAGRIRDKIGIKWFMFIAVMMNATKNLLLSMVATEWMIFAVTIATGFTFVGIHFCTTNYLNDNMPRKMRSTAQACSGLVAQVFGSIIAGPLGGFLADQYSTPVMMRFGAGIITLGGLLFVILFGFAQRYHDSHYGPGMVPLGPDGKPMYEIDENGDEVKP